MTPRYFSELAERLHPWRFRFALVSLVGFLALLAVGAIFPRALPFVVPLAGPLVFFPWVVFCACIWFHPERGNLKPRAGNGPFVWAHEAMRWYAAGFIVVSVVVALAVWPALAVLWL